MIKRRYKWTLALAVASANVGMPNSTWFHAQNEASAWVKKKKESKEENLVSGIIDVAHIPKLNGTNDEMIERLKNNEIQGILTEPQQLMDTD